MCVFVWYAIFTDLEKGTWEIQLCQKPKPKQKTQKQENMTKRKSRSIIINYNEYYVKHEKTNSIDLKYKQRKRWITKLSVLKKEKYDFRFYKGIFSFT